MFKAVSKVFTSASRSISCPVTARGMKTLETWSRVNSRRIIKPIGHTRALFSIEKRTMHDANAKGDADLVNFLKEEIDTEKQMQKHKSVASLAGFEIKTDGADVTFVRKGNDEEVSIELSINNSVDADVPQEGENKTEPKEGMEMKSRPNFDINIKRGNETLTLTCSFTREDPSADQPEEYEDTFSIDEVTLYEGEWNEKAYSVSGEILDGYFYDLFMNMLEDRGISSEFMDKISDYCTGYEQSLYIDFLDRMKTFFSRK